MDSIIFKMAAGGVGNLVTKPYIRLHIHDIVSLVCKHKHYTNYYKYYKFSYIIFRIVFTKAFWI